MNIELIKQVAQILKAEVLPQEVPHFCRIRLASGVTLGFYKGYHVGEGRIEITGNFNRISRFVTEVINNLGRESRLSITVSEKRSAEAIAKEIERRLLDAVSALYVRVIDAANSLETAYLNRQQLLRSLAAAGGTVYNEKNSAADKASEAHYSNGVDVRINHTGSEVYELTFRELTPSEAEALLKTLTAIRG